MTAFLRLLDCERKADALRQLSMGKDPVRRFDVELGALRAIPTSPFSYWLSSDIRAAFASYPSFSDHGWQSKQGLITGDNFRLVRVWWELRTSPSSGWHPFANGGKSSRFFSDIPQVVDYRPAAQEAIRQRGRYGRGAEFYFQPGLTWPLRASAFCAQALPAGCLFSQRGQASFPSADSDPLAYLALLSSTVFDRLYKVRVGRGDFPEFLVGVLSELPVPELAQSELENLSALAHRAWSCRRSLDISIETSHAFLLPAVLRTRSATFASSVEGWTDHLEDAQSKLDAAQREIDRLASHLYQVKPEAVVTSLVPGDEEKAPSSVEDTDDEVSQADVELLAAGLVSWCVGVAFGRFDVRLATGSRKWPASPDPFDPLPQCSPGMVMDADGLAAKSPPAGYPIETSFVLVHDSGHRSDITVQVRSVFDVVFGNDADHWWSEAGEALGATRGEVGFWLRKAFLDYHLGTYSKARRKAPIYWPLGTGSGSYIVWLYAHRVTGDSLFRLLTDVMSPKVGLERRRLSELVQEGGPHPSASQRKAIDGQEKLVGELQDFADELTAVAPLWHPDLNDGVVLVLAPLWRLFKHHKAWSKELQTHWDSLVAGEYDWAQLAMHLWPERVVPKCAEDRSLAIAHGLEDVFWLQDDDNLEKWHPRQNPTVSPDRLIADRTDPATKAALEDAVR